MMFIVTAPRPPSPDAPPYVPPSPSLTTTPYRPRSPSPVAPTFDFRFHGPSSSSSSSSSSSPSPSSSSPSPFSNSSSEDEFREDVFDLIDDAHEEVSQIMRLVTLIYRWIIQRADTHVYNFYLQNVVLINWVLSITIVHPLSFTWHLRTLGRRSPAQNFAIKEQRERWSAWLTNFIVAALVISSYFALLLVVLKLAYQYIIALHDFVFDKLSYLYMIMFSVSPLLPVTDAALNQRIAILQSQYQLQQNDIESLQYLANRHNEYITKLHSKVNQHTNDIHQLQEANPLALCDHLQENIITIVEKLIKDASMPTLASIAHGITTVLDPNNLDKLTFSPEFIEYIQQDQRLHDLLDVGKYTVDNLMYEAIEGFSAQSYQYSSNYADGVSGAIILYKNTSDSYPTGYWQNILKFMNLSHVYDDPGNTLLSTNECWTINGKSGTLAIALSGPTIVKQVAIEMLPDDDDFEMFSFEVYSAPLYPLTMDKITLMGKFSFDGSLQAFDFDNTETVSAVVIKFLETENSAAKTTICNVLILGTIQD